MGRRKKSEIEAENAPQSDLLVCPICGKEFQKTPETYCWILQGANQTDISKLEIALRILHGIYTK